MTSSDRTQAEIDQRFDEIITILRRLDDHRTYCLEWKRNIEFELDRIKRHLNIA